MIIVVINHGHSSVLSLHLKKTFYTFFPFLNLQGETMRIVYRMRGLLGDATEDMVNTLDTGKGNYPI